MNEKDSHQYPGSQIDDDLPPADPLFSPQVRSSRRWLPAIGIFCSLILLAFNMILWNQLENTKNTVADLSRDISTKGISLKSQLAALQSQVDLLPSLGDDVIGLESRISDLTTCINTYMKTVGDSQGAGYRYYFCSDY